MSDARTRFGWFALAALFAGLAVTAIADPGWSLGARSFAAVLGGCGFAITFGLATRRRP